MLDYFLTIAIIKGVDSEVNLQTKLLTMKKPEGIHVSLRVSQKRLASYTHVSIQQSLCDYKLFLA